MFEYLMPQLVMPSYQDTLLDQTARQRSTRRSSTAAARRAVGHFRVRLQRRRCAPELPVPRVRRARPGSQARPGAGSGDRALCQHDGADGGAGGGVQNLQRLAAAGFGGRFGLYEAIDYTPARLPRGQDHA